MTDTLGDAVRAAVGHHVDTQPVDASALLAGVLRRRPPCRWVAPVGVAAAVALVVAAAVVLRPAARAVRPVVPAVPAGQQAVSWHGVQVLVPASWRLDDTRCGTPEADTVLRPAFASGDCLTHEPPGLTVVQFRGPVAGGAEPEQSATRAVDLDGVPARRGTYRPLAGQYAKDVAPEEHVLVVPSEQVVVLVHAPTAGEAEALLDTVTVVDVDANGCPSRVPSTRAAGPATRPGAADALLPGSPTSVSVCQYTGRRLGASRRLTPDAALALQTRLDGLPTGRSDRVPVKEIADDYCREIDDDGVLLDAAYATGAGVRVWVRDQACTDRSTTNGSAVRKAASLDTYQLLHGDAPTLPAPRREPAPELGYTGLPRRQSPAVPAQRADVLGRTDDPAAGRLLGVRQVDGRRCLLLATSEATPPSTCDLDRPLTDGGVTAGLVPDAVRAVRVTVDGRQVAVVATYGAGAAYGQRRGFLTRVPSAGRVELTGLDGLGRTVAAVPPSR